jgi:tRNA A37 threonylcarbamoyladenosine modification protein TsaB
MATEANRYHVIGDARRNSYFFSTIERHECVAGPFLCTESELREHLRSRLDDPVFATQQLAQFPEALVIYPSALELARLAINARPNAAKPPLEPIYLREPHITVPQPLKTIRTHERN